MSPSAAAVAATALPPVKAERDGIGQLTGLQRSAEALFEKINSQPELATDTQVAQLLLTLELRNKLEEHLLFPALHDGGLNDPDPYASEDNELSVMRELAERVRDTEPENDPHARKAALLALEGVTMLHFGTVDRLLARNSEKLDQRNFSSDVQAMLARWHDEVLTTGDIEDEESDPVGLPPR